MVAMSGCTGSGTDGDESKTLTYWSMWTEEEPQAKVIAAAIDAFTEETGIKVDVEWQGRAVLDQVAASLASGEAPDLVDQGYDRLGSALNSQNALQDISDVLDLKTVDGDAVRDVINTGIMKDIPDFGGDVSTYMIPYTISTVSLFYNADSPYVTAPPATYDQLLADCDAAKAQDIGCVVSDGDSIWAAEYWFDYLLNRNAGNGSFAALIDDQTGAGWKSPDAVKTAEQVADLVSDGYMVSDYDASQYPAGANNWAAGKSLFYLMGSWVTAETQGLVGDDWTYGAGNFPSTGDDANSAVSVLPFGFAVPTAAKHADAAKDFIAFFSSPKYQDKIATEANNLTALVDGTAPANLEAVQATVNDNELRIPFDGRGGEFFSKVFDPAFGDLWLGKTTAEEFIDTMTKGSAEFWNAEG
jgi:raffinose/stachyose/melibiose transport system substrate-binding protein